MQNDPTKKLSELDQSASLIADVLPPHWKRLYDGIRSAGFPDGIAERVLYVYINANSGGRLSP